MTGNELKSLLKELGMTGAGLAVALDVSATSVSRWTTGRVPVPGHVEAYLEQRLAFKNYRRRVEMLGLETH
jgi:transcriptional regulator with XRE-family HTH domain